MIGFYWWSGTCFVESKTCFVEREIAQPNNSDKVTNSAATNCDNTALFEPNVLDKLAKCHNVKY